MANVDNPFGFRPLGVTLSGGAPQIRQLEKDAGYGVAVFPGDLVNQVADGSLEKSATPGTTSYSGVALDYGAASARTQHLVVVSPDAIFVGQDDGSNGGFTEADRGLLANAVLNAGSAVTLKSGHEINTTTKAGTGTLDLRLLDLFSEADNAYGANARVEVVINKHRQNPGVAGV